MGKTTVNPGNSHYSEGGRILQLQEILAAETAETIRQAAPAQKDNGSR